MAASQEEILQKWKEHFKNLLGNHPEVTDKSIKKLLMTNKSSNYDSLWKKY